MSPESQVLSLKKNRWVIKQGIPEHIRYHLRSFHTILQQLLYNRGIINQAEAIQFLEGQFDLHDPFLLKEMHKAIRAIRLAISDGKKIIIFGDYDADGVTATALLFLFLRSCGAKVEKFIPNRFEEGYGLSQESLERLMLLEPGLVITVDCGIRSFYEIDFLKTKGVDVIVSDHHQPLEKVPDCTAVICPKQRDDLYPFKELAGVGIAYKMAKAFAMQFREFNMDADEFLDLVAIGTIADLAPLHGENRFLVKQGLHLLSHTRRPGLCSLAGVSNVDLKKVNTQDIGFMIAPRLNAAGRMSSADKAFDLLVSNDEEEANECAVKLNSENANRQKEVSDLLEIVKAEPGIQSSNWLKTFIYSEEKNKEGIIGLVASKICEEYYRPAVVGSETNGCIKASCRSIPDFNMIRALDQCSDLLDRHGGHAMAAGFTVSRKNYEELFKRLNAICEDQLVGKSLETVLEAEMEVSLEDLISLPMGDLAKLEPTGIENPQPLFMTRNVKIFTPALVGSDNSHVKFKVKAGNGYLSAIAFRLGRIFDQIKEGYLVDILFAFETNRFNGQEYLQLNVKDIRLAHSD